VIVNAFGWQCFRADRRLKIRIFGSVSPGARLPEEEGCG